jgi:hypothetical protein
LAEATEMAENAMDLQEEVKALETYFAEFEKYMNLRT